MSRYLGERVMVCVWDHHFSLQEERLEFPLWHLHSEWLLSLRWPDVCADIPAKTDYNIIRALCDDNWHHMVMFWWCGVVWMMTFTLILKVFKRKNAWDGWGFQVLSIELIGAHLLKSTSVHPCTVLARNFYTKAKIMFLVSCFIGVICFYVIRIQFLSTFFAWVAIKLKCPAAVTGVPDNKDHQTLSVPMETSRYGLGST